MNGLPDDIIEDICKYIPRVANILHISKILPYKLSKQVAYSIVRQRFRGEKEEWYHIGMCEFINTCRYGCAESVKDIIEALEISKTDIDRCGDQNINRESILYINIWHANRLYKLIDKNKIKLEIVGVLISYKLIPICVDTIYEIIRQSDIKLIKSAFESLKSGKQGNMDEKINIDNILISAIATGNKEIFIYIIGHLDDIRAIERNTYVIDLNILLGDNYTLMKIIESNNIEMVRYIMETYPRVMHIYKEKSIIYKLKAVQIGNMDILYYFQSICES